MVCVLAFDIGGISRLIFPFLSQLEVHKCGKMRFVHPVHVNACGISIVYRNHIQSKRFFSCFTKYIYLSDLCQCEPITPCLFYVVLLHT